MDDAHHSYVPSGLLRRGNFFYHHYKWCPLSSHLVSMVVVRRTGSLRRKRFPWWVPIVAPTQAGTILWMCSSSTRAGSVQHNMKLVLKKVESPQKGNNLPHSSHLLGDEHLIVSVWVCLVSVWSHKILRVFKCPVNAQKLLITGLLNCLPISREFLVLLE